MFKEFNTKQKIVASIIIILVLPFVLLSLLLEKIADMLGWVSWGIDKVCKTYIADFTQKVLDKLK